MKHNKKIAVGNDGLSAAYKSTTLKAVADMPADDTLREQSKYVFDQLEAAHPEIVWAVGMFRFTPGKLKDTTSMWQSLNAS
jgi:hypothetical protein